MNINARRMQELEQIRRKHRGVLHPQAVVSFAESPDTALHSAFDWNDGSAGAKWRLWQARQLIRVMVVVEEHGGQEMRIQPYVSLPADRRKGGYRTLTSVLGDDERRAELLAAALAELRSTRQRYRQLQELAKVFAEIDRVEAVSDAA